MHKLDHLKDNYTLVHSFAGMGHTTQIAAKDLDQLPDQTNAAQHEKEASGKEQAQDRYDDQVARSR